MGGSHISKLREVNILNHSASITAHPIFNNSEFFIETPMIGKLTTQIERWIWNGDTGGLVLGDNRIGKSRAIRYVMQGIKNRLGESIPAIYISTPRRDTNTMAAVFKNLCFSLALECKSRPSADDMANLVYHRLADIAHKTSTRQVAMFVDEFQRLSCLQLEVFAEIYDQLSLVGVNICIIFVGNKQSAETLIENSLRTSNELVRGRFFIQKLHYHGIRLKDELRSCLGQYDHLKYPVENGDSYTGAFIKEPKFLLSNTTDVFWDIYIKQFKSPLGLSSWPMQYFTSAVRILLVDYAPRYGTKADVLPALVERSMEASGLVKGLVAS